MCGLKLKDLNIVQPHHSPQPVARICRGNDRCWAETQPSLSARCTIYRSANTSVTCTINSTKFNHQPLPYSCHIVFSLREEGTGWIWSEVEVDTVSFGLTPLLLLKILKIPLLRCSNTKHSPLVNSLVYCTQAETLPKSSSQLHYGK